LEDASGEQAYPTGAAGSSPADCWYNDSVTLQAVHERFASWGMNLFHTGDLNTPNLIAGYPFWPTWLLGDIIGRTI
jgi:hypothetical protein